MQDSYYNLQECLDAIEPASTTYEQWVQVGMALHEHDMPVEVWDEWSRRDTCRYHPGECERKWSTFGKTNDSHITAGSLVQMARDRGWEPSFDPGVALDWDDEIEDVDRDGRIVDPTWVEPSEIIEPGRGWQGYKEIIKYLQALFNAEDYVGYVVESWQDQDGHWKPGRKGDHKRTAGEIIEGLTKHKSDLASSLGKYEPEAGAWIRFNPLDGKGVRNDNVSEFRYALVESDTIDIEKQRAIIEELELPVAALVHSGNKSIHAIVRIDAGSYDEYRKRVDFLYATCEKNGLKVDTQNKNPSRLSRMPGVKRGKNKQFLIATNIGKASWKEWREWLDEINDDLPEPASLAESWDNLPELAEPLIAGVLRKGHKMLLSGPSKAGKSFSLIELCIAIAEGKDWMGFRCTQGRVLYVNLELDSASCLHRFKDVYGALGYKPDNIANIDIWNLRGKSKPMDKLAPSLIRRALKTRPIAVIIDPIYKVITGDENSADQMAQFCNQFDKICNELGCAVIYCHHHSKGSQGQKRSMDRMSGSGVFARDPDALLDLIELELTDDIRKQQEDSFVRHACETFCKITPELHDWQEKVPEDDQLVGEKFLNFLRGALNRQYYDRLLDLVYAARENAKAQSAWRIDGTLREFPKFEPVNIWFRYPMHVIDEVGVLKDIDDNAEVAMRKRAKKARKESAESAQETKIRLLREAMTKCELDCVEPTRRNVLDRFNDLSEKPVSDKTFRDWTVPSKAKWCPVKIDPNRESEGLLIDTELQEMLDGF